MIIRVIIDSKTNNYTVITDNGNFVLSNATDEINNFILNCKKVFETGGKMVYTN